MKIRNKLYLTVLSVTLTYIVLTFVIANSVLLESFLNLEKAFVDRNMMRANQALTQVVGTLGAFSADWAHWNDAYDFSLGKSPNFVANNLAISSFVSSNSNYVGYFNKQGKPLVEITADFHDKKLVPYYAGLKAYLMPNSLLLRHHDVNHITQGLILLPAGIMLVAASPVSTTDKSAPIAGTCVLGRLFSKQLLRKINETTRLDLALLLPAQINKNTNFTNIYNSLITRHATFLAVFPDHAILTGYILLRNIYNQPIGMLQLSSPRLIYITGMQAINYFLATNISLGLILILVFWRVLKYLLILRLERLNNQIETIGDMSKLSSRVDTTSNDELGTVAIKINKLLDMIQTSHSQLETRVEERTNALQQANSQLTQEINDRKLIEKELILSKEHLAYLAHYDNLTGLANRAFFNSTLNKTLSRAKRRNEKFAILFIDLDHFKAFNDAFGHHFGDEILMATAKRIAGILRTEDFIARLGGDEFIVLITNTTDEYNDVIPIIDKILQATADPLTIDGHEVTITCSIGLSIFPQDGIDLESLQKAADSAMYIAKKIGGNTSQRFTADPPTKP